MEMAGHQVRSAGETPKLRKRGQAEGDRREWREEEVKNILGMGNLFLYLTVFVLLSFHSPSIFPHIFTKHPSEGILLLMLGFKEETQFHICVTVMQYGDCSHGRESKYPEIVKCAHPETQRDSKKSFGFLCDCLQVNFTVFSVRTGKRPC